MKRGLEGSTFHLGLVGGRLQGLEAAYLGREAGYEVSVIDRDPDAPALNLAHNKHVFDVQEDSGKFKELLPGVDAILPTTEERRTLDFLSTVCKDTGTPFLHDDAAYFISSSKIRSNAFLSSHNIPVPIKWPSCPFPVVIKPSEASGSHGIHVVTEPSTFEQTLLQVQGEFGDAVVEAFHEGPSLSLEVIARRGIGREYVITELEFDSRWDCRRVYAPCRFTSELNGRFTGTCLEIARRLELNGLMDVEIIVNPQEKTLVVLEIDCRFPSQTPIAVYHASGINLLEEFVNMHAISIPVSFRENIPGCALLEHIRVENDRLEFIGETRLLPWPGVKVWDNGGFFGASVALTDYQEKKKAFKATLIFSGATWSDVLERRRNCIESMVSACSLENPDAPVSGLQ